MGGSAAGPAGRVVPAGLSPAGLPESRVARIFSAASAATRHSRPLVKKSDRRDRSAQDGPTPHMLVVVPRWGAGEQDDLYPWLKAELAASHAFDPVVIGDMSDPDEPTIDGWSARVAELAGSDARILANADANGRLWQERLGAAVDVVPAAAHFIRSEEPRVLAELLRWYSA